MQSFNTFKTDINRQAVDSLRGYVYQIHQSVFAALHLKEDEVLVLEGAEDFDIHSGNLVTTTQVKNKSSNISLNSQEIKDAIINYWKCKQKNSNHIIIYRYLITSNVAFERGKPFIGACP